jgi:pimeloyl-ACP methyl ester carboxylesterase
VETLVVDAQVMGELVQDRATHLLGEIDRVRKVLLQGEAEEADLVWDRREVGAPFGTRDPFVQAVEGLVGGEPVVPELVAAGLVLDDDRDLAKGMVKGRRNPGERSVDERLEPFMARCGSGDYAAGLRTAAALGHRARILRRVMPDPPLVVDPGSVPTPDLEAEPEGFVVEVPPGERIHFLDWGGGGPGTAAERPGSLLIHGLSQTAWAWAPVARRLIRAARVVAMDLRGHGLSDAPTHGYDEPTLAEDAVAVAEGSGLLDPVAEGAVSRVVVAGHGFGAIVAAWAAAVLGDRCAGLVLVDGGWDDLRASTGMEPDEFLRGLAEPPEVYRSMPAFLADRAGFDPASWDADQERAARASVVDTPAGRVVPSTRPHALAGCVEAMFAYRPALTLGSVRAPIVALVAADDEAGSKRAALAELGPAMAAARRPPIRIARFPDLGHNLMRYAPAQVTGAILAR